MGHSLGRPGHRKLVEWKSVDASLLVYVVRNPLDHYTAYIKELDEMVRSLAPCVVDSCSIFLIALVLFGVS